MLAYLHKQKLPAFPKQLIKVLLCAVILILLCVAAYKDALNGDFVFDDTVAIVKNADVTRLPTNFTAIFEHDFWGVSLHSNESHKSFRPLTTLMFHYEYAHLQWRAHQMKALNLLLHCLNTLLVWLVFCSFHKSTRHEASLLASALFAVHPVHTEAVSGIVGRAELLFAMNYLLALCITLCCTQKRYNYLRDVSVMLLTLIGVMCKETAITIPLACMFVHYMQQRVYHKHWQQQVMFMCTLRHIIYALFSIALIYVRLRIQDFSTPKFKVMDNPVAFSTLPLTRLLSRNYVYALNFWILVCPQWLSFDWALGCIRLVDNIWDFRLQLVLTLYSFTAVMLVYFRRNEGLILGFGLLLIPFLPASGIINVGFVIAERILYVPSIGFCYFVAQAFVQLKAANADKHIVASILKWMMFMLMLVFLLRTRERAREWLTEEKLFTSALQVCPNNAKVHYNIARVATIKNNREKAFYHYQRAIELYPEYEAAYMNLGNLYREKGELKTAEKYLRKALDVSTEPFAAAWMNLGIVLSAQKQYTEALKCYEKALKLRKNYATCHYNMGNLFLEQQMFSEAMHHWQRAIAIKPTEAKAWTNLLTLLDNRGLYEDVKRLSEEALKLHLPNEMGILFIRANVCGKLQQYTEAETLYKRILDVEPNNFLFHTNLGVLYHRWGKLDKAINCYETAIKINSKHSTTAHMNLKRLKERLNKTSTAEK